MSSQAIREIQRISHNKFHCIIIKHFYKKPFESSWIFSTTVIMVIIIYQGFMKYLNKIRTPIKLQWTNNCLPSLQSAPLCAFRKFYDILLETKLLKFEWNWFKMHTVKGCNFMHISNKIIAFTFSQQFVIVITKDKPLLSTFKVIDPMFRPVSSVKIFVYQIVLWKAARCCSDSAAAAAVSCPNSKIVGRVFRWHFEVCGKCRLFPNKFISLALFDSILLSCSILNNMHQTF